MLLFFVCWAREGLAEKITSNELTRNGEKGTNENNNDAEKRRTKIRGQNELRIVDGRMTEKNAEKFRRASAAVAKCFNFFFFWCRSTGDFKTSRVSLDAVRYATVYWFVNVNKFFFFFSFRRDLKLQKITCSPNKMSFDFSQNVIRVASKQNQIHRTKRTKQKFIRMSLITCKIYQKIARARRSFLTTISSSARHPSNIVATVIGIFRLW